MGFISGAFFCLYNHKIYHFCRRCIPSIHCLLGIYLTTLCQCIKQHYMASTSGSGMMTIQVSKGTKTWSAILPKDAVLSDLISSCEESDTWATNDSHLDWDKAKFIAKGQMLRSGPDDGKAISHLDGKKITLQVPTVEDIQGLQQSSEAVKARQARRQAQRRVAVPARQTRRQGESPYTFLRIEPLPGLRYSERSREFLVRLAEDPGIKAAMKKHQFTGTYRE